MPDQAQASINRQTYIPPRVEQAMKQQMQTSMPAHLRKYAGENPGYVPQHAQAEMAQHMEKSMPTHLKQYSGAYMQQRVIDPNTARSGAAVTPHSKPGLPPPMPDHLRLDHASTSGNQQYAVDPNSFSNSGPAFQHGNLAYNDQPAQQQPTPSGQPPSYDFIMSPQQAPRPSRLPGSNASKPIRIAMFGGGLVVLFILFLFLKGLLIHGPDMKPFISVAQDQQQIIHITTAAIQQSQQQSLTATNQNVAATAQLSLTSAQAAVLTYLKENHTKVKTKQLSLKVSALTDKQLTDAIAAGTYDSTFRDIMKTQLNTYSNDLSQAYKSAGPNGKALLKGDYDQAQLLLNQLNGS